MSEEDKTTIPPFTTASMSLPSDHWIYEPEEDGPPAIKVSDEAKKDQLRKVVAKAARNAIRAATMSGKEPDFDPDALVQNLLVQMIGPYSLTTYSRKRA